jgi:hypothetical protein
LPTKIDLLLCFQIQNSHTLNIPRKCNAHLHLCKKHIMITGSYFAATGVFYRWPHSAEDLYFEPAAGYIWNLTEYETEKYGTDNRSVFAVRLSKL